MTHSFTHAFFDAARFAPWIVGVAAVLSAIMIVLGKVRSGWKILGFAAFLSLIALLVGVAATALTEGRDEGYDLLGGALWFGIAILTSAFCAGVLAAVQVINQAIHLKLEQSNSKRTL